MGGYQGNLRHLINASLINAKLIMDSGGQCGAVGASVGVGCRIKEKNPAIIKGGYHA